MSAISTVSRGARAAERRMGATNGASTSRIWRKSGRMVQNETTGREEPEWVIEHDDLPCRIGSDKGAAPSRTVSTPGGEIQLGTRTAHFPVDTDNLHDHDLIEIVAGRLADTIWQIVESDSADQQTARRVPVIAAERPEEWL